MWYPRNQLIDENNPGVFLSITEGSIIEAFTNYYLEIWDKITPMYKDKSFIIPWFKNQIKKLEEKRR